MRYFIQLAYDGTRYAGWQSQPNAQTVQETLQTALATILRDTPDLTGCGRTDAGVHANGYYAHFDWPIPLPEDCHLRLNRILPPDIAIQRILPVHPEAHARFDAIQRRYCYRLTLDKNPFLQNKAWEYPFPGEPNEALMQEAANLLLGYRDFAPFCKTNTDAFTRTCDLRESYWLRSNNGREWYYWVTSDRFLRGMIRLIVGMCVRVAAGKTSLSEVREAMDNQSILHGSYMVPPHGLTLTEVRYPYL